MIHHFLSRWLKKKNGISDITDAKAIAAFLTGCRDELLTRDLGKASIRTMANLMDIATEHASGEEAWVAKQKTMSTPAGRNDPGPASKMKDEFGCPQCNNNNRNWKRRNPKYDDDEVNAEFNG